MRSIPAARRTAIRIVLATVALGTSAAILAGCATSPEGDRRNWLASNGGVAAGKSVRQQRAESALARLMPKPAGRPLSVAVLDTDQMGAFSWPSGHIYVSRALVDSVSEDELAGALAHELGHLLPARRGSGVKALRGHALQGHATGSLQVEMQADRVAQQIMADADVPPGALRSLLEKLSRDGRLSPLKRDNLRDRASRLEPARAK